MNYLVDDEERSHYPKDFPWDGAFIVPDIQTHPIWPYPKIDTVVDSLWLLGEDAKPDNTFGRIVAAWGRSKQWLAAGTSLAYRDAETQSWIERWPGFGLARLGWVENQIGDESKEPESRFDRLKFRMEWWRVAPDLDRLVEFIKGPLFHPRQGFWLAVANQDTDAEIFVRTSMGMPWSRSKNGKMSRVGPEPERSIDDPVTAAMLCLLPHLGFVSVVSLNNHPVSGTVFLGSPDQIAEISGALGGIRVSAEGREVTALWHRACWLATL